MTEDLSKIIEKYKADRTHRDEVITCQQCCWYDGDYCRHYDFVQKHTDDKGNETFKVWNVSRNINDFCSYAEEGEYEPWGFED